MSLVQHGSHTAKKRKIAIIAIMVMLKVVPKAMVMWDSEAQVLSKTWPACGNLVLGRK